MGEVLTKDGNLTLPACLASTLEAVALPEVPSITIRSVGAAAWLDVRGLESVGEAGFRLAVSCMRDYVASRNARQGAVWVIIKAIDAQLSTAKKECLHLRL